MIGLSLIIASRKNCSLKAKHDFAVFIPISKGFNQLDECNWGFCLEMRAYIFPDTMSR